MPEITEADARTSVLRNTNFALGHEIGGAEWEGIKQEGVGHDRESTLMGAALTVRQGLWISTAFFCRVASNFSSCFRSVFGHCFALPDAAYCFQS